MAPAFDLSGGGHEADDALRAFRAGEARLDPERRARMAEEARLRADKLAGAAGANGGLGPDAIPGDSLGGSRTEVVIDLRDAAPRRRTSRRLLLGLEAVGVVAAVLVAFVIGIHQGSQTTHLGTEPTSERALVQAARDTPDHRLQGGSVLYQEVIDGKNRVLGNDKANLTIERTIESWVAPDGAGLQESSAERILQDRTDADVVLAPQASLTASAGRLDFATFSYEQLRDLPVGGRDLLEVAMGRVRSGDPSSSAVGSLLASLLAMDVTSPLVRAAAVGALFDVGVKPVGQIALRDGQSGEGLLGQGKDGVRWLVVVDPVSVRTLAFVTGVEAKPVMLDRSTAGSWTLFGPSSVVPVADLGR